MVKKTFQDPFVKLFGSVTRVRLLRLFLFNPKKTFTASEASERVRAPQREASRELQILVAAGLLRAGRGAKTRFSVDEHFPYFSSLQQMLLHAPLRGNDVYSRMRATGVIKLVILAGIFTGEFENRLDLLVVGDRINERRLRTAIKLLEADTGAEIHYASLATPDFQYRLTVSDRLLRDVFDYPHRIVFDKLDMGLK